MFNKPKHKGLRKLDKRGEISLLLKSASTIAIVILVTSSLSIAHANELITQAQTQAQTQTQTQTQLAPNNSETRKLKTLRAGETIIIIGHEITAKHDSQFIEISSSEYITLAVTSGELVYKKKKARSGKAIVLPIANNAVEVFDFDAYRLMATLPSEWLPQVQPRLQNAAAAQKRSLFWGLLEPTGVNATSPLPPFVERVRSSYLSVPAIIELRNNSQGDPNLLQTQTVEKFKEAIILGDVETIAALIDPLPFTDSTDDATVWLAARRDFAQNLSTDFAIKNAFAAGGLNQDPSKDFFLIGQQGSNFKIVTVNRDSAVFIAAVEPFQ